MICENCGSVHLSEVVKSEHPEFFEGEDDNFNVLIMCQECGYEHYSLDEVRELIIAGKI